ncbi:MAG: UDP-N-acetylmuramate dehydrogenase [Polyangia bacterium]
MNDLRRALASAAGELCEEEPLSRHTSLRIGGPARLLAAPRDAMSLSACVRAARRGGCDLLVLGGGTNLLVSDDGFDGLALRPELAGLEPAPDRHSVAVGAAVPTAELVDLLVEEGLAGLEFAAGLPGTVGGAIAGNAGCFGESLGERLLSAEVVDKDGAPRRVDDPSWFGFDYRLSSLARRGAILTRAVFAVEPGDRARLREVAESLRRLRRERHPARKIATAGSYFRNPPAVEPSGRRRAAGALLDAVGAKRMSVGDAAVFERHANIVINRGRASAREVLELTNRMARAVRERFGVELAPEVRFVGPRPTGL